MSLLRVFASRCWIRGCILRRYVPGTKDINFRTQIRRDIKVMRLINRIDPGVNLEACVGLTTELLTTGMRPSVSIGRSKINLQIINVPVSYPFRDTSKRHG